VWGKNAVRRGMRAALVVTGGATFLLVPAAAHAQETNTPPYGGGRTIVSPTSVENSSTTDPVSTNSSGDSLPFTGGDIAGLAAIGAGAVGVGIVASRARRHRTA
jgi:hypothetical protein